MWEIIAREMPFHDREFEWIDEVKDAVMRGVRPTIPSGYAEDSYLQLMCRCWSKDPEQRPSFATIVTDLNCMTPEDTDENVEETAQIESSV